MMEFIPQPGVTLMAIGVSHCIYGFILPRVSRPFLSIFRNGLVGQVKPVNDGGFWFQITGGFMIAAGELMRVYLRDSPVTQLPLSVAYGMIGMGCLGSLGYWNTTLHGFPLLILQGLWMIHYKSPK